MLLSKRKKRKEKRILASYFTWGLQLKLTTITEVRRILENLEDLALHF